MKQSCSATENFRSQYYSFTVVPEPEDMSQEPEKYDEK